MNLPQAGAPWTDPRTGLIGRLVRVAFLVRLLALAATVVSMAMDGFDTATAALAVALSLTSYAGLRSAALLSLVVRHPIVAVPDTVLVFATIIALGWGSPLALVAVSSALIIGLLFALRFSAPLCLLLVSGQLMSDQVASRSGSLASYVQLTVVLVSVTAIGTAFRFAAAQQHAAAMASADALAAAAAAEERLRLARDMHDTVAKSVQGLALAAAALPSWIKRNPDAAYEHAQTVADGAREAVAAARGMLGWLRLDDVSRPFHDVLNDQVRRWAADRDVDLTVAAVPGLSPVARHELLAAAAEALENVDRHAPQAAVRVVLTHTGGGGVDLRIIDDGPGFSDEAREQAVNRGRFGLVGMDERLARLGGRAVVESARCRGTTVRLIVPASTPGAWPAPDTVTAPAAGQGHSLVRLRSAS